MACMVTEMGSVVSVMLCVQIGLSESEGGPVSKGRQHCRTVHQAVSSGPATQTPSKCTSAETAHKICDKCTGFSSEMCYCLSLYSTFWPLELCTYPVACFFSFSFSSFFSLPHSRSHLHTSGQD